LLIKYYPNLGVQYGRWSGELMWVGVAAQKNGLGILCFISIFFLTWKIVLRWRNKEKRIARCEPYVEVLLLAMSFWLFMGPKNTLTYSSTSTAALTIGLMLFYIQLRFKKLNRQLSQTLLTVAVIVIVIYGTITPFVGGLMFFDVTKMLNRSSDLTGRGEIWAIVIPMAMKNPMLGYGFGGFSNDEMRAVLAAPNAHNGYLESILNIGFLGLLIWAAYIIFLCRKACSEMTVNSDWGILWYCLLTMGLMGGAL
jgi:O-antigen ligase